MHTIHKLKAEVAATSPVREIPRRLDVNAIVRVLASFDIELPANWQTITAAGQCLDTATVRKLDNALSASCISISERMRLKYKLSEHGLLPRGRSVMFSNALPEKLDPWRSQFVK